MCVIITFKASVAAHNKIIVRRSKTRPGVQEAPSQLVSIATPAGKEQLREQNKDPAQENNNNHEISQQRQ